MLGQIQLEDQWSTLCSLSVGTKSKSGSANSGLAQRFPKMWRCWWWLMQVLSMPSIFQCEVMSTNSEQHDYTKLAYFSFVIRFNSTIYNPGSV